MRHHRAPGLQRLPPWSALARTLGTHRRAEYGPQSRVRRFAPRMKSRAPATPVHPGSESQSQLPALTAHPSAWVGRRRLTRVTARLSQRTRGSSAHRSHSHSQSRGLRLGLGSRAKATQQPRRSATRLPRAPLHRLRPPRWRRIGAVFGGSTTYPLRHRRTVVPNTSFNADPLRQAAQGWSAAFEASSRTSLTLPASAVGVNSNVRPRKPPFMDSPAH